jgi:hypothetical protein
MKVFDFNIHLPQKVSEDVNDVIDDDMNLTGKGLVAGLNRHMSALTGISGANVLLFNQKLFQQEQNLDEFKGELSRRFPNHLLTHLIDFRDHNISAYLERAAASGVRCFMFNSYLQQIAEAEFAGVLQVCKFAERNNIIICIDGSYGTSKMFTYDNMKLACYVADQISKVPIVIIHSGGYRVMEAMLLAMDKRNVILDTSFSLDYYLGSSLEQDYAFVYKRMGASRVVFGSDLPYMPFKKAFDQQLAFFQRNRFSDADIEKIFYTNALDLSKQHGK